MTKIWKSSEPLQGSGSTHSVGLRVPRSTPPCASQSPPPVLSLAKTRGSPTYPLQRPHFAIFLEQVHVTNFFPAEANCDSASAIAENFANYSVSSTLAPRVVNLLAIPAEVVSVKTVSSDFQATALFRRTEDS